MYLVLSAALCGLHLKLIPLPKFLIWYIFYFPFGNKFSHPFFNRINDKQEHRLHLSVPVCGLPLLATLIWSDNFIIARGVIKIFRPLHYIILLPAGSALHLFCFPLYGRIFLSAFVFVKEASLYFYLRRSPVSTCSTLLCISPGIIPPRWIWPCLAIGSPILSVIFARIFLNEQLISPHTPACWYVSVAYCSY